jgi:predicted nucleic acid-binding protein
MAGFILDTNHLSEAIRRVSKLRERIRQEHRKGRRFAVCWPVLCEVEAGISQNRKPEPLRRTLKRVLEEVRVWPFDWAIAQRYGELFKKARRKGYSLSHVDLVIAAYAMEFDVTVLTADQDFQAFPEIRTENWLT